MSKARLVITAVVLEGRPAAEVIADYGISRSWLYELLARYREHGDAAFEPQSRRPHTSPTALSATTIDLIVRLRIDLAAQGLDAGPATLRWHLQHHHQLLVSDSTIARTLTREGLITPEPKKRPKSSYIRFEATMPNECWQSDFTHYPLANGTDTEILSWLDDHARYALRLTAHPRVTGQLVLTSFRAAGDQNGYPASTLTDNGMVYTVRFATGRGGITAFEAELRTRGIAQKNSRPNHPTTCGKVERFQQTLKKWLRAQPVQPTTIAELQHLLDAFREEYNHRRPHRSLPHSATPAATYNARPKATPSGTPGSHTHDEPPRVCRRLRSHERLESWQQHAGIRTSCVSARSVWF